MKPRAILLPLVSVMIIAGLSVSQPHEARAQFLCNGVVQGHPNCAPPKLVEKKRARFVRSFGALAYDEGKAVWYGSFQYPSKSKAQNGALAHCQENGGSACKLMLSYTNQCAAVARALDSGVEAPGKDSVNTGSTEEAAEANARRSCQADWGVSACSVKLVNCSHHNVTRWTEWGYQ